MLNSLNESHLSCKEMPIILCKYTLYYYVAQTILYLFS